MSRINGQLYLRQDEVLQGINGWLDSSLFLDRLMSQEAKSTDLTVSQLKILLYLNDKARTQTELVTLLSIHRQSLVRDVKSLEGKGFIAKLPDDADGRKVNLHTTEEGKTKLSSLSQRLSDKVRRAYLHIGPEKTVGGLALLKAVSQE